MRKGGKWEKMKGWREGKKQLGEGGREGNERKRRCDSKEWEIKEKRERLT